MGEYLFFYPRRLMSSTLARRAFVAKRSRLPVPSKVRVEEYSDTRDVMIVRTPSDLSARYPQESGALYVPIVDRDGCFFHASTDMLPCSGEPVSLFVELARGQLSRLIQKQNDWSAIGFAPSKPHRKNLKTATAKLAALLVEDAAAPDFDDRSVAIFKELLELSRNVNEEFLNKVLEARRSFPNLKPTRFGFAASFDDDWQSEFDRFFKPNRLGRVKIDPVFQTIKPEFSWVEIETTPGVYDWTKLDETLQLAEERNLEPILGPIVRWGERLPRHVRNASDQETSAAFLSYVDALVEHVGRRATRWIVATNVDAPFDSPSMETRLVLAVKTAFAIRAHAPKSRAALGFEQPCGDAARRAPYERSPFELAQRVARRNVFDGFYLELNIGPSIYETAPRDPMEWHRFFDRWCSMGTPLYLATSCPSAAPDFIAQQEQPTRLYESSKSAFQRGLEALGFKKDDSDDDLLTAAPEDDSFESSVWTERNQRETARRFFTSALSRRCVDEIVWTRWRDKPVKEEEPTTRVHELDPPAPLPIRDGEEIDLHSEDAADASLEILQRVPSRPDEYKTTLCEYDPRDAERFPASGLFDRENAPKPTLHKLAAIRRAYID